MKLGDLIHDRYRLERPLGKGGMAEVWCATDERLARPVAIKFLAPQFHDDPEFLVRFFSEAQSVAQIQHPNVVQVLDFGDHEDRPYLVMEYVGGGSVGDLSATPIVPERAAEIVAEAARGAGAAHRRGLTHRDIKPANILLSEEGHAKLADFGIASSLHGERLTATGQAIGSPHYVSPEQATGSGCDARSDVYSLGVVLYQLITGRPPFDADNVTAIVIAQVEQTPKPPSTYVPDVDPALEALVLRCLEKDPEERYPDGAALAVALEDPVEAQTIFPLGDGEWDDAPRARHRLLAGALITTMLLVLLAAAVAARRPLSGPPRQSYDQETVDREGRAGKANPRPASSKTQEPVADASITVSPPAAPTPSPSPTDDTEDASDQDPSDGRSASSSDGRASPERDETEAEPQPTPEAEPSSEPAPTPGPTPEPTP